MPNPSPRRRAAVRGCAAVLGAVLVVGGTTACTSHDDPGPTTAGGSTHAGARPGATPGSTSTSGAGTPGSASTADTDKPALVGLEPGPTQTPGPGGLLTAGTAGQAPSLTGPLPATGAANGSLVAGFPTDVIPVPAGVEVVSSSLSASGTTLQVGLQGSSSSAPSDVQGAYTEALGSAGFAVSDSPALPGSTATAYTRGPDGLVLTVRERLGGGTELTVAGVLTTAG